MWWLVRHKPLRLYLAFESRSLTQAFVFVLFVVSLAVLAQCCVAAAVMYDKPCRMRGLFGEGMRETHQVLFVAEKLIHKFLPRLASHLDKETIHVTMYATQWLLTQYTSSFRFDLVTRVWDCFLFEGWKITYRVMLSLLQHSQATLLAMSFEEILAYFRELPERSDIGGAIIDEAIKIPLRTIHITKFEKEWRAQQQQQGSS
jgi:Rab-GTPase-TBC domain